MAKRLKRPSEDEATPDLAIPLPLEGLNSAKYWQTEIEQAIDRRKKYEEGWKTNVNRQRGETPKLIGIQQKEVITVNDDFANTEQKKSQLFHQTPVVHLTAKQAGAEQAAPLAQAVLNSFLGPEEIDAEAVMDELLEDCLCPAGFGAVKIGYEDRKVDVPNPVLDPLGQPVVDPATGQPQTELVPNTIWQRYYMERISPVDVLVPASFTQSRHAHAPWLGFVYQVDADSLGKNVDTKRVSEQPPDSSLAPAVDKEFQRAGATGYEIWYKASLYDASVKNPDLIRRLVIIKQTRQAQAVLVHEDSPYQRFDPATGRFLLGVRGFPIRLLTLRTIADTTFPPSDCAISRPQVDELSLGRSQMVLQRRRNIPLRGFDGTRFTKDIIEKIKSGDVQGLINFPGPLDDTMFKQLAPAEFPRENFTFNDYVANDIAKLWALGKNQSGLIDENNPTATQSSIADKASENRMAKERARVVAFFASCAAAVLDLLQLYADESQTVQIIGPDGEKALQTWDKTQIQGRFAFEVKPDSSIRINAADERELFLRYYNFAAKSPNTNLVELDKQLALKFNQDPARIIKAPEPPPPEKPKINFSFKGDDLLGPQAPVVLSILEQSGVHIDPTAIQNMLLGQQAQSLMNPAPVPGKGANQPHGGAAPKAEPLDKHDAALTGQRSGPPPIQ